MIVGWDVTSKSSTLPLSKQLILLFSFWFAGSKFSPLYHIFLAIFHQFGAVKVLRSVSKP
jgi:hypothetical protein